MQLSQQKLQLLNLQQQVADLSNQIEGGEVLGMNQPQINKDSTIFQQNSKDQINQQLFMFCQNNQGNMNLQAFQQQQNALLLNNMGSGINPFLQNNTDLQSNTMNLNAQLLLQNQFNPLCADLSLYQQQQFGNQDTSNLSIQEQILINQQNLFRQQQQLQNSFYQQQPNFGNLQNDAFLQQQQLQFQQQQQQQQPQNQQFQQLIKSTDTNNIFNSYKQFNQLLQQNEQIKENQLPNLVNQKENSDTQQVSGNNKKQTEKKKRKKLKNFRGYSLLTQKKTHVNNIIKNIGCAFLSYISEPQNKIIVQNLFQSLLKTNTPYCTISFFKRNNKKVIKFSGIISLWEVFFEEKPGNNTENLEKKVLRIMLKKFLDKDFYQYCYAKQNRIKTIDDFFEFRHDFKQVITEIGKPTTELE